MKSFLMHNYHILVFYWNGECFVHFEDFVEPAANAPFGVSRSNFRMISDGERIFVSFEQLFENYTLSTFAICCKSMYLNTIAEQNE